MNIRFKIDFHHIKKYPNLNSNTNLAFLRLLLRCTIINRLQNMLFGSRIPQNTCPSIDSGSTRNFGYVIEVSFRLYNSKYNFIPTFVIYTYNNIFLLFLYVFNLLNKCQIMTV